MPLPRHFCWTRFGTEAGETIEQILVRKEDERLANGGLFLWGIGNAIGPSMRELVRRETSPEVVFSPIRSRPRKEDVEPVRVVEWKGGRTLDGAYYDFPLGCKVTSRSSMVKTRQKHYALVCVARRPLRIENDTEVIPFDSLRNLLTNRRVGVSQVTAIVCLGDEHYHGSSVVYSAAIRAELVYPFFIELTDAVALNV